MDPHSSCEDTAQGQVLSSIPRPNTSYIQSMKPEDIKYQFSHSAKESMGTISAVYRSLSADFLAQTSLPHLVSSTPISPWNMAMIPGGNSAGNTNGSSGSSGANSASSSSSNSSSTGSSKNTSKLSLLSLYPTNPSLGLVFLAPLVPAADNRPALVLLTAVQLLFGLSLMTKRTPKFGESRFRHRATSALRYAGGSVAVFLTGFEILRLAVPCDPWAEEARKWRKWAVKNGHNPSWWYGGISHYVPMPLNEWKVGTTTWIANLKNVLEAEHEAELLEEQTKEQDSEVLTSITLGPRAILKAGESNTYHDIHEKLYSKNVERTRDLLTGELEGVTELNKAARIDAILEKPEHEHLNEEYTKPSIQLGTHRIDSDADFEMVWANFEPWDELRQETDYDVRLIPRWRCVDESVEEK